MLAPLDKVYETREETDGQSAEFENEQASLNSSFQKSPGRNLTWMSQGERKNKPIDYITINKRFIYEVTTLINDAQLTTAGDQLSSQHAHSSRFCSGTYMQLCANDRTVQSKGQQQVVKANRQLLPFTHRRHSRAHRYWTRTP